MSVGLRVARYLFLQAAGGVLIAAAVVLSAILLVDVVEQLREVGTRTELPIGAALRLTLLRAPLLLEQALPFVILAGVLFTLVKLNRRNEITVLRASGLSPFALAAPGAMLAFLLGVAALLGLSPAGAALQQEYQRERDRLLGEGASGENGYWFSQGDDASQVMIHAEQLDANAGVLRDVTLFFFYLDANSDRRFSRRVEAERADLLPGFWQLSGVIETTPLDPPQRSDKLAIPTPLTRQSLVDRYEAPAVTPVYELPAVIRQTRQAGLLAQRYETRLQGLLASPALFAAMALIASAFSARLPRLGGLALWASLGVGLGFAAYFVGQVTSAMASSGAIPPIAAAWGPALAALFAACALLVQAEGGHG